MAKIMKTTTGQEIKMNDHTYKTAMKTYRLRLSYWCVPEIVWNVQIAPQMNYKMYCKSHLS